MRKFAILLSNKGTCGKYLLNNDPNYSKTYEIACAFTDNKKAEGIRCFQKFGIPCESSLDFQDWMKTHGHSGMSANTEERLRRKYFEKVKEILKPYALDMVILSGFRTPIPYNFYNHSWIVLTTHPKDFRRVYEVSSGHDSNLLVYAEVSEKISSEGPAMKKAIDVKFGNNFEKLHRAL